MGLNRIKIPLEDVLVLQRGFDLPSSERIKGIYPVVASTGVVGTHNLFQVKGPGVVIGRSGSIGGGQYIETDFWPLNTTLWVKDSKGNDMQYIYYLLKSIDFSTFNNGTGVPTLNRNHLNQIQVTKFNVNEQKQIAKILGDLDRKIEIDRKMNELLEQIGQALFKKYFIDNPEREEWEETTFGKYFQLERGLSYKGKFLDEKEGLPMINLGSFNISGEYSPRGLKYYTGEYKSKNTVRPGDLVMANTDITQQRTVLGSVLMVPDLGNDILFTHHVNAVRTKGAVPNSFLYFALKQPAFRQRAQGFASGTTILALPKEAFDQCPFYMPNNELLLKFSDIADNLLKKKELLRKEIISLSSLRNSILPKLMSGKIKV